MMRTGTDFEYRLRASGALVKCTRRRITARQQWRDLWPWLIPLAVTFAAILMGRM